MTTAEQWIAAGLGGPEVLRLSEVKVRPPGPGEVTIQVRAAGMNPADYKHFGPGQDSSLLPLTIGYEVAGVISNAGPGSTPANGDGKAGDEVAAFQIMGGYATAITVAASDVFVRPAPSA